MGDDFALDRAGRKSGRHRGNAYARRKCKRPATAQDRGRDRGGEKQRCCGERGLAIDGEIDDGARAESDREPWHQPAGSGLDRRPFANALRRPAREIGEALRPGQRGLRPAAIQGRHASARPRDLPCSIIARSLDTPAEPYWHIVHTAGGPDTPLARHPQR